MALVFRVFVTVLLVAMIALVLLYYMEGSGLFALPLSLSVLVAWIFGDLYMARCHSLIISYPWLMKQDADALLMDLNPEKPDLTRSGIWSGVFVLVSKKPWLIIGYDQIGWAHISTKRTLLGKKNYVSIHTRSGKSFSLRADLAEFQWLLENRQAFFRPDTVMGYDEEREAQYYQRNPEAAKAIRRERLIWSTVLFGAAVCLLVVSGIGGNMAIFPAAFLALAGLMALVSAVKIKI